MIAISDNAPSNSGSSSLSESEKLGPNPRGAKDGQGVGFVYTEGMRKTYTQVYRIVWNPDNSRTTLHRRKMEKHIGRKLQYNEIVHHKNKNKLDNRLVNLEVMHRGSHSRLHAKNPEVVGRDCLFCGKHIFVSVPRLRYKKNKSPYHYCSRSCGAKAQWKRGAVAKNIGQWSKRK